MRINREWCLLCAYGALACLAAFSLPILAGATADYALSRPASFIGGVVQ